jgi:hypothetical protein
MEKFIIIALVIFTAVFAFVIGKAIIGLPIRAAKERGKEVSPSYIGIVYASFFFLWPVWVGLLVYACLPDKGAVAPSESDAMDQLAKLGDLRDRELITEEEFLAKKQLLLAAS